MIDFLANLIIALLQATYAIAIVGSLFLLFVAGVYWGCRLLGIRM